MKAVTYIGFAVSIIALILVVREMLVMQKYRKVMLNSVSGNGSSNGANINEVPEVGSSWQEDPMTTR